MADQPVLTYRGRPPTSAMLVELWTNAEQRFGGAGGRTDRITKCRDLRRGTERAKIDTTFLANHPEVDQRLAVSLLPERETYERELIARAGAVEITVAREPLDVTDTAVDQAERYESYMREVAADPEGGIPEQTLYEKGCEDGEYGYVSLPAHLDADGLPDFYDRLTERAVKALKAEQRREYRPDPHDRRGRYVRTGPDGSRRISPRFERDSTGRTRKDAERSGAAFTPDRAKSRDAHEEAVRRYMLEHRAASHRVIPALDCYPLLGRGKGRARWAVEGLIERALFERETLVEKRMGWNLLGDRLILPRGVSQRMSGVKGQLYLYTAYLMLYAEDDEDGVTRHPCVLYTVGGAGTWWDGSLPSDEAGKKDAVAIIDLWEEQRISTPLWGYEFAGHTADDDPNYYGRPAIWPFRQRILNVEQNETAGNVTTQVSAYTGHYYKPDAALLAADPEAVVETQTHTLRRPTIPKPGEIQPWAGDAIPFAQSQLGADHYRMHDTYYASLKEGMAVDEVRGDTGHAMLVSSSQGQISKRHIREAALRAFRAMLQNDARIRLGAYKRWQRKWPILTSREQPVGHEVRSRLAPVEFEPDWLGPDENVLLTVAFGEELNLARADLEMNAAMNGFRALKHVAAAFGEPDEMNLRFEIAKDAMWKDPENQLLLRQMVDARRAMTRQRQAAQLQAQQRMTKQGLPGVPGAENGLPAAMLRRTGAPPPNGGGGGPNYAASVRGGVEGADKAGDALAFAAQQQTGVA